MSSAPTYKIWVLGNMNQNVIFPFLVIIKVNRLRYIFSNTVIKVNYLSRLRFSLVLKTKKIENLLVREPPNRSYIYAWVSWTDTQNSNFKWFRTHDNLQIRFTSNFLIQSCFPEEWIEICVDIWDLDSWLESYIIDASSTISTVVYLISTRKKFCDSETNVTVEIPLWIVVFV